MKRKISRTKCLAALLAAFALCGAELSAQQPARPDFERDIRFARELNAIGLFDYAEKHIQDLVRRYPEETLLKAQQVDNMLAQNRRQEAFEIAKTLPKNTVAYCEAIASIGTYAIQRNDFEEAYKQLSEVRKFAEKANEVKRFKTPLLWLLATCQKLGRLEEAQQLLALIQNAESAGKATERELLYNHAEFTLASIEMLRAKEGERSLALLEKLRRQARTITADPALLEKIEDVPGKEKLRSIPPPIEKLEKMLDDSITGRRSSAHAETPPAGKPAPANAGKADELSRCLADVELQNDKYCDYLQEGQDPAAANNTVRLNAYRKLGRVLDIPEPEMLELAEINVIRTMRPFRRELMLKDASKLSPQEQKVLSFTNKKDWQDAVYLSLKDLEQVQWGGLNMLSAFAVAQIVCCRYYLSDCENALVFVAKFKDLYKACDDAFKGDKEHGIEDSPSANARMWEGRAALALAMEQEKSSNSKVQKQALRNYKRAFIAYGLLLKKYPKHKEGPENYPVFQKICEKLVKISPNLSATVAKESAKVPKPKGKKKAGETIEELVTPLAAQEFKDGYTKATSNTKRLHTKKPPTAADWKICKEHFTRVVQELQPALDGKRKSNGMPKLLNHLMIAYGYLDDPFSVFMVRTLSDFGRINFQSNPLVAHGALTAGNAMWSRADRMKAAARTTEPADRKQAFEKAQALLKDQAIAVYDDFLEIDRAHKNAPFICARIAREEFKRANAVGVKFNQEKKTEARAKLRREWIEGFDRSIGRYQFILDNFRNQESLVDEAYERSAEAYAITERFEEAITVNKKFCEAGSSNRPRIVNAKMEIATNLYRKAGVYEKEAKSKQESAAAIIIPEIVKPERKAAPPEAKPATAAKPAEVKPAEVKPAEVKPATAAKPAAPAETPAQKAAREAKEEAEYQAALAQYEKDVKNAGIRKEKKDLLNKEADGLLLQAKACYKEAISHVLEFTKKWIAPKGPYADLLKDKVVQQNIMRAASLLPWLYDGAGDKNNAIEGFKVYIAKYPKEKAVPQYMMRLSILYTDLGRDEDARKVLDRLSTEYKDTPEGKNAKFALARNLYSRGNYKRALSELQEIFGNPELQKNLTVSNYRWISSSLADCPASEFRKQAAGFAFQASEELLKRLKPQQRNSREWVSDLDAVEFSRNKTKADAFFRMIQEKLLLDTAIAASAMGDDKKAVQYYDNLKKFNKDTPYYYQMAFGRSAANVRLKNYTAARKDLLEAGTRANYARQSSIYNKAQTMIGDIWEMQNSLDKAFASYWIIAALPFAEDTVLKMDPSHPEDDTPLYLEKAVFKAAETAKKIGRIPEMKRMIEKYRKYYPDGRFKTEIRKLEE